MTADDRHDTAAAAAAAGIVALTPVGRDASVICDVLNKGGIGCAAVGSMSELAAAVGSELTAAIVVAVEALTKNGLTELVSALAAQAPWSDLPVLLLLADDQRLREPVAELVGTLRRAGNVTVLFRPVPAVALVTTAQAAMRARRRQFEVRDLMAREHAARVEAERANHLKDEFLATVSHELRTPLSAILLWSKLASAGRLKDRELPEALRNIERSAQSQSRLIDDLLDAARMTSGQLRLNDRQVEVEPAVRAAIDVVRPSADAKGVRLTASLDARAGVVRADPDRMQQIVWNLLSNAVKFTARGGDVLVRLGRDADDAHVFIEVADTGKGIHPAFLAHVFDRFRQADASAGRRQGGLGLGLAITHQLVELHGGAISVRSDGEGKGSAFIVQLPLARDTTPAQGSASNAPPAPDAVATAEALRGVRILLVEDDPDVRRALTLALEAAGAGVVAVSGAIDALDVLQRTSAGGAGGLPDVLLSDIGLPGMDGYQLIEHVRATPAAQGGTILAIAITAYATGAARGRALEAGFQSHLAKPLDPDELVATVADLLKRRTR
ncbi:MAG TPA: ATP-binding protein [Tepidisphaeraceae bacterium]|nr:ATP-binding protein [Tepidisphaeraceae bacterium]